jgi:hypothetical protein
VTAAALAADQQQQQAAGLRSLLFGPGSSSGMQMPMQALQQPQPTLQALSPPAPAAAPAPGAGAAGASGALLSSSTAADRWAWMGAFGASSAAGTTAVATAPQVAPPGWLEQQQLGLGQLPAGLRTDNPFVP